MALRNSDLTVPGHVFITFIVMKQSGRKAVQEEYKEKEKRKDIFHFVLLYTTFS